MTCPTDLDSQLKTNLSYVTIPYHLVGLASCRRSRGVKTQHLDGEVRSFSSWFTISYHSALKSEKKCNILHIRPENLKKYRQKKS